MPLEYAPGVELTENIRIPVAGGVTLAADLYAPTGRDAPLPVVIEYQPYRKDDLGPGHRFYSELPGGDTSLPASTSAEPAPPWDM